MKPETLINAIIDVASPRGMSPETDVPYRSFGILSEGISFSGDALRTFTISLAALYGTDKDVQSTISKKTFEAKFIEHFATNLKSKSHVDGNEAKAFLKTFSLLPKQRFAVLREIFGATIDEDAQPVTIGPFKIYRLPKHQHLIESKTLLKPELLWIGAPPAYAIEVSVTARHCERALEIGDEMFARFESTMRFVIGSGAGRWEVGVLRFSGLRFHQSWAFQEDGTFLANASSHGAREHIDLSAPYFTATDAWHRKIWDFLSAKQRTELQTRILLAVDWLGQAYGESSRAVAFLKAAIALEIVFTHNEKTIINASILSQISESVALLIGKTGEERRQVESRMKQLYSQRSAIAHSGDSDVSEADLQQLMYFGRSVISRLIGSSSLLSISSVQDLYERMKDVKYSCGEI